MAVDFDAELGANPFDLSVFDNEGLDHVLPEVDIGVGLERCAPLLSKLVAVVLSTR